MEGGFDDAVRLLRGRGAPGLARRPVFTPLKASAIPRPVLAVDGSHAVLRDTGAIWIVAVTAEALAWPNPPGPPPTPEVIATTAERAEARLAAAYGDAGLEAPSARSAESFAEGFRALREAEAALRAIPRMASDGLLLLDGALHGLPPGPSAMAARILDAAGGRLVAGVAKRSRLEEDGKPLVTALFDLGSRDVPKQAWFTPTPAVERSFVCRLHGSAAHAFRVDVNREDALPAAAALCRDAAYLGYPYPLAKVHNRVALTASRVAELRAGLDSALRREGGAVARSAQDPHEMLDRSVPR